jgi:hypothetical protein
MVFLVFIEFIVEFMVFLVVSELLISVFGGGEWTNTCEGSVSSSKLLWAEISVLICNEVLFPVSLGGKVSEYSV